MRGVRVCVYTFYRYGEDNVQSDGADGGTRMHIIGMNTQTAYHRCFFSIFNVTVRG